jgi:trigger factor
VVLDLNAFVGGKPVADGEAKGFVLEVGANRFHPDFETKLIGAGKGDHKEIEVTFPKDYGNEELAGKATTFKAEIKDIKERRLPDLDDDLAKNLGEFESLAELRHAIRQEIEVQKKAQADDAVAEQILNELLQRNPFEIPQAMVEQELQRLLDTIRYRLSAQNVSLEQTGMDENRLKEEHRESAGKKVRKTLLLEQIASQEDLNVGDEELEQRLRQAATEAKQTYEKIRDFYEKNDLMESFKRQLIEEKVIAFLMNHAEITEVEGEAAGSEDDNQKEKDSS